MDTDATQAAWTPLVVLDRDLQEAIGGLGQASHKKTAVRVKVVLTGNPITLNACRFTVHETVTCTSVTSGKASTGSCRNATIPAATKRTAIIDMNSG